MTRRFLLEQLPGSFQISMSNNLKKIAVWSWQGRNATRVFKNQIFRKIQVLKNSFFSRFFFRALNFLTQKTKENQKNNNKLLDASVARAARGPTGRNRAAAGVGKVGKQQLRTFLNSTNQSTIHQYLNLALTNQSNDIKSWI